MRIVGAFGAYLLAGWRGLACYGAALTIAAYLGAAERQRLERLANAIIAEAELAGERDGAEAGEQFVADQRAVAPWQ